MPLVKITDLNLHYGEQVIFDKVALQLEAGDRLCLIGRNGVGKSTLLKVIEGGVAADEGSVWRAPTTAIASVGQDLPAAQDISVYDFVAGGLARVLADVEAYERALSGDDVEAMAVLQARVEAGDGWNLKPRIEQVLTRLELDGADNLKSLSGGWRRRAALARALVVKPDVLLLDEPTNHLDVAAIEWLELQLKAFRGALVFITHDRAFLRALANRIAELDRGALTLWRGDYTGFLDFKRQQLETEARHAQLFDKKLAQEEAWIRQGIKARRTRNEGRVRALQKMREQRAARRESPKQAKIEHSAELASGKLVAQLRHVHFAWQEKVVVSDFSTTILRGDKVGLIGPNGVGKSTLLKLILGELVPQRGQVRLGTQLSVAYFDQLRDQLDLDKNAVDNVAGGRNSIEINGAQKHVISYLQDFLFSGERARTPISALSGGERNRILLAKLFSKPSNLLVMDEPTNDLDAETLELLEDLLIHYPGTLLLVSHDRDFLDNVVTSTIAFEGEGVLREYVGGYGDWLRQGGHWPQSQPAKPESIAEESRAPISPRATAKPGKLSYKLQRELDSLPAELEQLEAEIAALQSQAAAPDFYQGEQTQIAAHLALLAEKEAALMEKYERWETLESMQAAT